MATVTQRHRNQATGCAGHSSNNREKIMQGEINFLQSTHTPLKSKPCTHQLYSSESTESSMNPKVVFALSLRFIS